MNQRLQRSLTSAFAAACLAPLAAAGDCEPIQLSLDAPLYQPGDAVTINLQGPPLAAGLIMIDLDPGPVNYPGVGLLSVGLSSSFAASPISLPQSGELNLPCGTGCDLSGLRLYMQVARLDDPNGICLSDGVTLAVEDTNATCGDCGPCDGKINTLILEYQGLATADVTVVDKNGTSVFADSVDPGEQFSFIGLDKNGTLSPEITISAGDNSVDVHTSCSQPLEIGMVFGEFLVIGGSSRNGGPLCEVD